MPKDARVSLQGGNAEGRSRPLVQELEWSVRSYAKRS